MAGMLEEQTSQQINGLPELMEIPILGTLFRSRDYVNHQTELMILVTPYTVHAVPRRDLSRPDDGFANSPIRPRCCSRFNRLYGVTNATSAAPPVPVDPQRAYRGNYGFILD